MGGGRRIAAVAALVVLAGLLGACSSDSSKASKQQKRAAHARVAAAKRAKQAARRQVRRAVARQQARERAAARRRAEQARLLRLRRARAASPARDLVAIRRSVGRLNTAFDKGVRRGIARSIALNYWVGAGVYDPAACTAFESDAGEGVVAETLVVHPETFRATPEWVDPAVGRTPGGRLYAVGIDEIQTLVPTGEQRMLQHDLHASVGRDGHARLFLRCA